MGQTILTKAELEAHDPEGGRGGRWLCPLPACASHTDKRRHRNLDVEPEGQKSGVFFCHRCGARGQLKDYWKDFVPESPRVKAQRVRLRRDAEEARKLEEIGARFRGQGKPLSVAALLALGASGHAPAMSAIADTETIVSPPEASEPAQNGSSRTVHPELKETLYRAGSLQGLDTPEARAFLSSRGFSGFPDAPTRARVRFAPDFGRRRATQEKGAYQGDSAIVFPISDDAGQLVAFQGRKVAPKEGQTKVLSFGPKSAGVFWGPGALEAWQEGTPLALTEAPFDALTLALCGVPAVALCGSSAPPEFLTRGAFGRRYWLAFDADDAGDRAAEAIGASLKRSGGLVERLRPSSAKDWNEALQAGGAVWDRTAEALRALIAREAKARPSEGSNLQAVAGEPLRQNETENQGHAMTPMGVNQRKNQSALLPEFEQIRTGEGGVLERTGTDIQGENQTSPMGEALPIGNNHGENQSAGMSTIVDIHEKNQTASPDLTHWQEGGIFHATTQDRLGSAWGAAHAFHKPLAGVVWHKDKGVKVEDIARWLQLRDEQIKGLSEGDDAPLWTETKLGARIAADLCEFALWWASGEAWADPPGVGSL